MDQWAVRRRRRRVSCAMGLVLSVLTGLAGGAATGEILRFGIDQATFGWSPPEGIVDGYVVLVSRDGGPETVELVVDEPHATLDVAPTETLQVRVRAFGRLEPDGPILVSQPSVASDLSRFVPAPVWPGSGALVLHCAPCGSVQLRALSGALTPPRALALPAPWRFAGVGGLDADASPDALWQNEDTGELRIADLGANPAFPEASTAPIALGARAVVDIARIEGASNQVAVLRNDALGTVEFWGVHAGRIVALGLIPANVSWNLVAARDLDGDGFAELWWQTDRIGRLEVWRTTLSQPVELLARIDTGVAGSVAQVADYDGDARPEALWRDAQGGLSITYFRPGGGGHPGFLEDVVTLPGHSGDDLLEIRGSLDVDGFPGEEILVQHVTTYRLSMISPTNGQRGPLFDLTERFELVEAN